MQDLGSKTVRGSAWMVAMRMTVNLLGFCSTIILARLLTPQDFGLVALAGSAYTFFSMFGQFGFDIPLIQLQDASREHYDTAWTANILVGLFVAVAMFAIGRPAAVYFQDARIEYIIYSFAILSLAKGFENIGVVNFRKQLAFRGEFLYFVIPKLSSLTVGVSAAFVLRSYWALVIGMIAAQTAGLIYSHVSQPFRPRLSLAKFSELFSFGKWILASKFLRFLTFNGMEVTLGRLIGPAAVGLYAIARQVSFLPSTEIAAPINRALFPGFATISGDSSRLRSAFAKVVSVTATLSFPAAAGIFAIADPLIRVVFGEKWIDAAPILAVLAGVGALYATNNLVEPILMARGALRLLVKVQTVFAAVLLPLAITLVINFGPIGIAYALLISSCIATPAYYYAVRCEIGFTYRQLASCLWRPALASAAMAVTVRWMEAMYLDTSSATALSLAMTVAIGAAVYPALLGLLWLAARKPAFPEPLLLEMLGRKLGRRAG